LLDKINVQVRLIGVLQYEFKDGLNSYWLQPMQSEKFKELTVLCTVKMKMPYFKQETLESSILKKRT
jgi:hypothetical protein